MCEPHKANHAKGSEQNQTIQERRAGIVPNAETIEAIRAAERGELIGSYATVDELMADLHADE